MLGRKALPIGKGIGLDLKKKNNFLLFIKVMQKIVF